MNEEMLRGLTSRRSNRAFAPEQITDEELHKVLAAGMNAPTAKNGQSPIIIAVQNPDEVAAVNALNAKFTPNANPYYGAPTILLVLVPRTFPLGDLDGAAVLTNLCNGAYAAGLASCWINRPQFMFETNEGREMLKRWGVEGDWRGVGSVAVGPPAAPDPEAKPRKENYCSSKNQRRDPHGSRRWYFYAFLLPVNTIPTTAARNAIGASRTKTNSNPCRSVPAAASSGSL